jgi:hypothetical protein
MKKILVLFLTLVFSALAFGQTKYKAYSNTRFGYSILYPSDMLKPSKLKDASNSGEIFYSKDKSVEMRVWGEYNASFKTLEEQFEDELQNFGKNVTYKILLKNGFVISGFRNGKIFYQKTMRRKLEEIDVLYTFIIEYKKTDRKKFDSIIQKIAKSFKFDPKTDV